MTIELVKRNSYIEIRNTEGSVVLETQSLASVEVIQKGQQGARGEKGDSGTDVTAVAGAAISAYRCVYLADNGLFYLLLNSDIINASAFAGITPNSVVLNNSVGLKTQGVLTNSGWNFIANEPVFLGVNGEVTQIVPTSGFLLRLGFAKTSTSILFNAAELTIL